MSNGDGNGNGDSPRTKLGEWLRELGDFIIRVIRDIDLEKLAQLVAILTSCFASQHQTDDDNGGEVLLDMVTRGTSAEKRWVRGVIAANARKEGIRRPKMVAQLMFRKLRKTARKDPDAFLELYEQAAADMA